MKWLIALFPLLLFSCKADQSEENEPTLSDNEEVKASNYNKPEPLSSSYKDELLGYRFTGVDLCTANSDHGPIKSLDYDTLQKYGKDTPYQIQKEVKNDSIYFTFKSIHDCCVIPRPSIEISQDSLKIFAGYEGDPCDCMCDYIFEYAFLAQKFEKRWMGIMPSL